MPDESGVTAKSETPDTTKRRGPRKEADIRAELEAEMKAQIEAERAKMRAELEAERAKIEQASREDILRSDAAKSDSLAPVKAQDLDGDPSVEGSITVHFLDDGLTLLGKVWYRGEELTINPGTPQWEEAHEVLSMDELAQEARWKRRFFRAGPWRGKRLDEIDDPELTDKERQELRRLAAVRDERYAPVLPR